MKQLFEFLLKFKPVVYQQANLEFQNTGWFFFGLAAAGVAALVLLHVYLGRKGNSAAGAGGRRRLFLLGLRLAALLLVLLMLAGPVLLISEVNPRENRLGVLVDQSRSMQIQDRGEQTRAGQVRELLRPGSNFVAKAEQKFQVGYYAFADQTAAQDLQAIREAASNGKSTNLEAALEGVLQQMAHLPLAGIVVISDGADNASRRLNAMVEKLRLQKIPIHTVGVGRERLDSDVELLHASVPRRVVPESFCTALLSLRNSGFGGSKVRVEVRDGDALIQSREITLQFENGVQAVELPFPVTGAGVKNLKFAVETLPGDLLPQNNWSRTVLEARDFRPRILYAEGEPRWEYKFLRRAMADDRFLQMETLLRTANKKFYRQGIESEDTLAAGFPSDTEDLFRYQGLILGTVESSFFTYHQLEMIRDFVGKRGGGFLMTGGKRSFGEGNYQNTPIEEILPARLHAVGVDDYRELEARPELTLYAKAQAILNLSADEAENARRWKSVPPLQDYHVLAEIKPAAVALATAGAPPRSSVLVASQRYGRGQALIFASGSSWFWQMGMEPQDNFHEVFWRQLLRWMVHDVPGQIVITPDKAQYVSGETAVVRAEVFDKCYDKAPQANPLLKVTDPGSQVRTYPMEWTARDGGIYSGQIPVDREGIYRLQVESSVDGETIQDQSYFLTAESNLEFHDAGQHVDLLKSLSEQSGGRYYPIEKAGDLPDEIIYQEGKSSHLQVKDLWDAPLFYFLILILLGLEWGLRRRWGYA
ncbi:MAG: VWA domain-containing protein [Acidobacteria bacterium]|nr:VWA domain-containing protein [Acidobacteriota bacterium]